MHLEQVKDLCSVSESSHGQAATELLQLLLLPLLQQNNESKAHIRKKEREKKKKEERVERNESRLNKFTYVCFISLPVCLLWAVCVVHV